MRQHIDLVRRLMEMPGENRPTRTRTRTTVGMPDLNLTPAIEQPIATMPPRRGEGPPIPSPLGAGTMNAADARTRAMTAANRAMANPEIRRMAAGMNTAGIADEIDNAEAARRRGPAIAGYEPVPPNPENLPAIISRELVVNGEEDFNPNWIKVRDLPGYMQTAIRALGRQIFRQFTDYPIEDIQMMCTLTHSEADVKRMTAFIRRHGMRDDEARIELTHIMPGFETDVQLWRLAGEEFLLTRDIGGYYIYGWPGGRGVHLPKPEQPRRLR